MVELAQRAVAGVPIPALIIAGMGGVVALLIYFGIRADKKRREAIASTLGGAGWSVVIKPEQESSELAARWLGPLSDRLKTGGQGVKWFATHSRDGLDVILVEHAYTTGSGKNRHTVYHTVAAVPCPSSWSRVVLTAETLFTRIGKHFGMKDLELEHPEFNKRWRVQAEDENLALAILSQDVQAMLAEVEGPRTGRMWSSETWHFGRGCVAVLVQRSVAVQDLPALPERLFSVMNAMEPTLQEMLRGVRFNGMHTAQSVRALQSDLE